MSSIAWDNWRLYETEQAITWITDLSPILDVHATDVGIPLTLRGPSFLDVLMNCEASGTETLTQYHACGSLVRQLMTALRSQEDNSLASLVKNLIQFANGEVAVKPPAGTSLQMLIEFLSRAPLHAFVPFQHRAPLDHVAQPKKPKHGRKTGVAPAALSSGILKHGPEKKGQEVDRMVEFLQSFLTGPGVTREVPAPSTTVIDVGAGHGDLVAALAVVGIPSIALERDANQLAGSRTRIAEQISVRAKASRKSGDAPPVKKSRVESTTPLASADVLVCPLDVGPATSPKGLVDAVRSAISAAGTGDTSTLFDASGRPMGERGSTSRRKMLAAETPDSVFLGEVSAGYTLCSLHACGSLSDHILRLFAQWCAAPEELPPCRRLVNVGCCYNLITSPDTRLFYQKSGDEEAPEPRYSPDSCDSHVLCFPGFNTSDNRPIEPFIAGKNALMAAAQAPRRWVLPTDDGGDVTSAVKVLERAAIQVFLWRRELISTRDACVKISKSKGKGVAILDREAFVRRCVDVETQLRPDVVDGSAATAESVFNFFFVDELTCGSLKSTRAEIASVVWTLRAMLGQIVESLIVVSRCATLADALSHTDSAWRVAMHPIFDHKKSPRNVAVVAESFPK